jgi:hypothetical protein
MALSFPTNPSLNDEYSYGGMKWIFDGSQWVVLVWAAKDTEVEMGCLVLMAAVAEEDVVVWVAVLHQLTEVMVEMGVLTQSQALP